VNEQRQGRARYQTVGLILGPALAGLMLILGAPEGLSAAGWRTAAVGVLMAVWWATDAIPIAATALLPVVLFPFLDIASVRETSEGYFNRIIMLFLGGFIIAFAMQRWNLHRRIALNVLRFTGGNGRSLVGGFMLASALISMWVMNTSTTMMLLPIAVSIIGVIHQSVDGLDERTKVNFQCALLLGVAYASSIGGMATLVGTAPNGILAGFMQANYDVTIDFARWILVGLPLSAALLPLAWVSLTRFVFPIDFKTSPESMYELRRLRIELGSMSTPEKRVGLVFLLVAFLWMFRPLLVRLPGLDALDDAIIAIFGALLLFLLPSGDRKDPMLLRWETAEQLPWGVLILFGGGLTLASAVAGTGLAEWLGSRLEALASLPVPVLVAICATLIIFLTELTSNITTTSTFLPVVAAVAMEAGIDPIILAAPITLAASCAFMLPVATPPNAIVFASRQVSIAEMARAGIWMNLIGLAMIMLFVSLVLPWLWA
jgi:sodium-dependent dicarboxylate transporter 2/3/5